MKKFVLLITLLVAVVFIIPTYAVKPPQPADQVEIINAPENPVPVTTDDQLDVNVTNASPIPVTIPDAGSQKTIVSAYILPSGSLRIVPADKIFILTDIVVDYGFNGGQNFFIKEDTIAKFHMTFGGDPPYTGSFHFVSGIPFAPGSNVNIESSAGAHFMVTGYEIDF